MSYFSQFEKGFYDIKGDGNEKLVTDLMTRVKVRTGVVPIINSSYNEKLSFINSLNGQYVISGPSGAPTRGKTEALPTGKNFFSIDSRGLPTESAWSVGCQSASQILDLYKQDNGADLKI